MHDFCVGPPVKTELGGTLPGDDLVEGARTGYGDSGGPLYIGGKYAGIVKGGVKASPITGVNDVDNAETAYIRYTDVTFLAPWIDRTIMASELAAVLCKVPFLC